jgi:N-methylhydantoinase A
VRDFVAEHLRTYGHGSPLDPVEVVAARLLARVKRAAGRRYQPLAAIERLPRDEGSRRAYFGPALGELDVPVVTRAALLDGERPGPLLVDEYDSTCVVPPGCLARLDAYGNIEVDVDVG